MPKIRFRYKNEDEWENIDRTIRGEISINNDYESKKDNGDIDGKVEFLVVPLFEFDSEKNEISPRGVEIVKKLRLAGKYNFRTIFLVTSEFSIPDVFNPHKTMYDEAVDIIKNPMFSDTRKSVLLGEIVFKKKDNDQTKIENILNTNSDNFIGGLKSLIETNDSNGIAFRERYYDIFVKFYESCENGDITIGKYLDNIGNNNGNTLIEILNKTKVETSSTMLLDVLDFANEIYNFLNGTGQVGTIHRVKYELFRAPISFPLQELIDAKKDIKSRLHKHNKKKTIKLLLIDNKLDKIITKKNGNEFCEGGLKSVLFDAEVSSLFKLTMLGDSVYKKERSIKIPKDDHEYEALEKKEKFNYDEFKKGLDEIYTTKNFDRERNHAWKVYKKIKKSDFVLLDFFLNQENTYLAFDFIKDMAKIKKQEGDSSTTWYFITSAVYDSVVKYSQSGLLAEYYESAVVSAGDDPTNKKRQIIFLYKLLTFINARFKNFCNLQETIYDRLLKDKICEHWDKQEKKCKKNGIKCLEKEILGVIRRYLNEFNDVKDIFFPDETEIEKWQDIVESLENVIKQFIWLPEADWYMIQHQIDFINNKLGGLQDKRLKKCKFSFKYIIEELKDRSEVY